MPWCLSHRTIRARNDPLLAGHAANEVQGKEFSHHCSRATALIASPIYFYIILPLLVDFVLPSLCLSSTLTANHSTTSFGPLFSVIIIMKCNPPGRTTENAWWPLVPNLIQESRICLHGQFFTSLGFSTSCSSKFLQILGLYRDIVSSCSVLPSTICTVNDPLFQNPGGICRHKPVARELPQILSLKIFGCPPPLPA